MPDFKAATVLSPEELGVLAVSDSINHLVGNTATLLNNRKTSKKGTVLVLHCEKGNFRYRAGQHDGANSTTALTFNATPVTTTNGTGKGLISAGDRLAFAAGTEISFVGDAADAVLTYWYQ